MTPEWVQATAAIATFLAAGVAVWATFQAPRRAAQFAEELRQSGLREDEDRRLKLLIFSNLMQYRAELANPVSVASLNVLDVVFKDSPEVRLAFAHFLEAAHADPFSNDKLHERYLAIVEKVARDIGLHEKVSIKDIQRVYFPRAMAEANMVAALETQERLSKFAAAQQPSPNPFDPSKSQ